MGISKEQLLDTVRKLKTYIDSKSSTNNLTNELKTQYDNAANKAHIHANKNILDQLSQTTEGKLLYNGKEISSSIIIDSTLDATSENPVQNKAIKKYIDDTLSTFSGDISGIIDRVNRAVV